MARNVKSVASAMARTNKPVSVPEYLEQHPPNRQRMQAGDGLENVVAGLGTDRDKRSYSNYAPVRPLQRFDLENIWRSSWMGKRTIMTKAGDMYREWRSFEFESEDTTNLDLIQEAERNMCVKAKFEEATMWGDLYGGCIAIMNIRGTSADGYATPLDPESVGKGDLLSLTILDRWRVSPSAEEIRDLTDPDFGLPLYYILAESGIKVHCSRVLRFNGAKLPYFSWLQNARWDDSELQHPYEALLNADSTTAAVATMMFEANVDVITNPNLAKQLLVAGGDEQVTKRYRLAAMMKSFNRTLLLSDGETYDKKNNSFANLDKVLQMMLMIYCGAVDIPMTRFLGTSAAGLGATGEGEEKQYNVSIKARQEGKARPALEKFDQVFIRSVLGTYPADYKWVWNPLILIDESKQATIDYQNAQRDQIYLTTGILSEGAIARDLQARGTYPTMSDEDVDLAQELADAPPDPITIVDPNDPALNPSNKKVKPVAGTKPATKNKPAAKKPSEAVPAKPAAGN